MLYDKNNLKKFARKQTNKRNYGNVAARAMKPSKRR